MGFFQASSQLAIRASLCHQLLTPRAAQQWTESPRLPLGLMGTVSGVWGLAGTQELERFFELEVAGLFISCWGKPARN
jgi:hypothetical protein